MPSSRLIAYHLSQAPSADAYNAKMNVTEIRDSLDDLQKELLQEIAEAYMSTRSGVLTREMHRKYGKPQVVEALRKLKGIVYEREDHQSVSNRYEPTFLGLLVCPQGIKYEQQLAKFLEHLELIFETQPERNTPERNSVTSEEIATVLKMTGEDAFRFYFLVQRAGLDGNCSYSVEEQNWTMQIFREVDELPSWSSKVEFLHSQALRLCSLSAPVFLAERYGLQSPQLKTISEESRLAETKSKGNGKDQVFISYSHKDTKFLDQLLTHLKPLVRQDLVTKWSDRQIAAGDDWLGAIKAALSRATIAVLMVSPHFLASDFIDETELNPLLKEAERGGVRLLWIPVRASSYKDSPIAKYQAVIPPDKPIAQMKAERDAAWVKICQEIKKAVQNPEF